MSETIKDYGDWKDGINIRDLGSSTPKGDPLTVQNDKFGLNQNLDETVSNENSIFGLQDRVKTDDHEAGLDDPVGSTDIVGRNKQELSSEAMPIVDSSFRSDPVVNQAIDEHPQEFGSEATAFIKPSSLCSISTNRLQKNRHRSYALSVHL